MTINKSFETERLILKPTTEEDSEFILSLFNSPKWLKYIGDRNIHSIEDAKSYIRNHITSQFRKTGFSVYTIILKSDPVKMGICGLYDREGIEGIDFGFAFLPQYEKKGYASEASKKLMLLAFTDFGIRELKAITTKDNLASQKLLENLGFQLKDTIQLPNDDEVLWLYQISQ